MQKRKHKDDNVESEAMHIFVIFQPINLSWLPQSNLAADDNISFGVLLINPFVIIEDVYL